MKIKSYRSFKERMLRTKEVRREYEALAPEFMLVRMIIQKRIQQGLTQQALAAKIGTQQSAIARLESGTYNPTLSFLEKVACALHAKLVISLRAR
jgi:predicted transcriptional regulator